MPQISDLQWLLLWNADVDFELWKPPNANFSLSSCTTRPDARRTKQVWSDVQERPGSQTPGTPNASGTVVGFNWRSVLKMSPGLVFCHQPPFPNDWHNFKLPPICPTDQVSRLFCTISNSFFFLEGTVTPCRYYIFFKQITFLQR